MRRGNIVKKGVKIIAKIDAKLAKERGTQTATGEKYSPHDDWSWNDH